MVKVEAEKPAKFAEGLGYQKLSVIFIIACIFGDVYEIILNFCFHFFGNNGEIFLERRSAVIYGPFSVIYGVGAVILAKFLAERGLKWWQIFIRGALICGIAEIVSDFLHRYFFLGLQQSLAELRKRSFFAAHYFSLGFCCSNLHQIYLSSYL